MVGTRPEAIKLAPVVSALDRRGMRLRLILTGQHPLSAADYGLSAHEHIRLGCSGGSDPRDLVERVSRSVSPLLAERPGLIIVHGDTASAFGGALTAFATRIPVAHVEAGLRSFDPQMPWPEEEFRTAIDARADLLFAPTEISAANLEAENVPGRIFVTGNTGIDALLAVLDRLPRTSPDSGRSLVLLVTCHRRESWGDGLRSIAAALSDLAGRHPLEIRLVLHPNPAVASVMRELLPDKSGVRLLEPVTHEQMIKTMLAADIILSDSGGMQEEAPALGVPLLVLREKTERPEGVASGNMLLVGTDRNRIVASVEFLLDPGVRAAMSRRAFPYGDGQSAERIAGHIAEYLALEANPATQLRQA
ncbi:non-hydrolyzing UDP-N-acetylglucosamine 2-epimerase [Sphingomonas alba]|uniref:non-hydrolyzing UDP-N-acetylglucosamine 2-epimerase n=1 Tax=Sphingomonas alba TaxID=2908208 RepID=UPI0032AEB884